MNELDNFIHKDFIRQEMQYSEVYSYMREYISEDTLEISNSFCNPNVKVNSTIWILWLQGMNNAPKIVHKCYCSICENKPDGLEIIILDIDNINEYVRLPEFIWDKYNKGIISSTHLSDIIRIELLFKYGGCWIDATVYCMDIIPDFMIRGDLFMFKLGDIVTAPVLKMSSWWIYARKGNRLIEHTRNSLYKYWNVEERLVNYFTLHIIMSEIIDTDSECRMMFDEVPYYSSGNAHFLQKKLASKYSKEEWDTIKYISPIQKLTYKGKYIRGDIYNYYSAILDVTH